MKLSIWPFIWKQLYPHSQSPFYFWQSLSEIHGFDRIEGIQVRLSLRHVFSHFLKKMFVLDVLPFCRMYAGKQKDLQQFKVEVCEIYRLYTLIGIWAYLKGIPWALPGSYILKNPYESTVINTLNFFLKSALQFRIKIWVNFYFGTGKCILVISESESEKGKIHQVSFKHVIDKKCFLNLLGIDGWIFLAYHIGMVDKHSCSAKFVKLLCLKKKV